MQGETTERSVIEALDRISASEVHYDTAVIIRGGGSTTDLSWFDSYDIAFYVTQFPVPVLTGIGHEKDLTVTDMVAWKSLKTPTAVADFLVAQTLECENMIVDMATSIYTGAAGIISSAIEQLSSLQNRTAATARLIVRLKREQLGYQAETLQRAKNNMLRMGKELTDQLERSLVNLDPAGVMHRGFTLTTKGGKIIRSSTGLEPGEIIITHFEDGKATSIVKETNKKR
jgi:exodeoxyribonuclease VII large subunit